VDGDRTKLQKATRTQRIPRVDNLIAEIQKSPLEKLCISVREYRGHRFIEIRLHFLGDDDAWHPTKKGVTISPGQWDEFMTAVVKVQAHLPAADSAPGDRRSSRGIARG
jgi:hypothetical protein